MRSLLSPACESGMEEVFCSNTLLLLVPPTSKFCFFCAHNLNTSPDTIQTATTCTQRKGLQASRYPRRGKLAELPL
jgi:hypothetical protein